MLKVGFVLLIAVAISGATAEAAGPLDTAKLCADRAQWQRVDGSSFKPGACLLYVVAGGTLTKFTTSSSTHQTTTRVDRPQIENFLTRIIGMGQGTTVYDSTVSAVPSSAEANAAIEDARQAGRNYVQTTAEAFGDCGQIATATNLIAVSHTSSDAVIGTELGQSETSGTKTITFQPDSTARIDAHTHTESFVTETHQATVTTTTTYLVNTTLSRTKCPG